MYYSSGNYEAFAKPLPPEGVGAKTAYLVGGGIAALAAACFLVRDGKLPGERIHILEKNMLPGGACDGYEFENIGYVSRGERELDDRYECMWELLRSIPSGSPEGSSVLDELYWLNKRDPNYSLCRATKNCGEDARLEAAFGLSDRGFRQLARLFFTPDEKLEKRKITDVFDIEVLSSNFWLYWRTLFAFENWHSALEFKRYLHRFLHQIGSLPDLRELRFTATNEYEAVILPMVRYLEQAGVRFEYGVRVVGVAFDCATQKKHATRIDIVRDGAEDSIDLTEDDLLFITNGGMAENSGMGSQDEPAPFSGEIREGGSWDLWRQIAAQDPSFGHPDVFIASPEQTNRMSATVTTLDKEIVPFIKKICKRDPFSGRVVTGGPVTAQDSSWLLSWSVGRQPRFHGQQKGQLVVWLTGLQTDKPGDHVGKIMRECSGREICEEWLYHMGVPKERIRELAAEHARTVPVIMPFAGASFLPRSKGDRPQVVPEGSRNFAFIGQFAETARDAAFTTEYSVRTAMEAVYTLLEIDRGVPEPCGGAFDVRVLLEAATKLRDEKPLREMKLGLRERLAVRALRGRIRGTDIERALKEYQIL